ncbi:WSC domain-containing protein [Cladophialophora carrionii]|uniref:WSC domain-containing protein n=1 Tax=Cladophialophora carrionii TaxID=86049 RepID=A0A1C1CQQ5_9EURO|nr:WSC domain-containing protein [Cladophialophora carrionii]
MRNVHGAFLTIVLSLAFGNVDAFWRMVCSTVQVGRIDPIVNPGGISGHCHTIAGPNNINTTSTFDSLQAAYCTSCSIQKDKSAYWTPNLYYRYRNGSYQEVPHDGTVVYYLDRGVDVANMQSFPKGFRMLSGDAAARSYDKTLTYGNKSYGGQPMGNRASFACLDSSGPQPETPGFKSTRCDSGLRAQIHFQSCWDGVNLYKTDQSHVAYLSGIDNGICPPTHPVLLPHLFFEVIYSVNSVDQSGGGMFVFAQGDTTGYGFHGDFLNGWDPDVLDAAIDQCMGPGATNNGQIGLCPPLQASVDPYFSQNCPEQAPIVNETVHGLLKVLPGCNPPTGGPIRATQNICPVQPQLNYIANQDYKSRSVAKPGDKIGAWQYMGCAFDAGNPRPLSAASYSSQTGMTIESCTAYCKQKGYFYAGLEFASQCYCAGTLQQPIQSPLNCSQQNYMTCSGDTFKFCGGQQLMQVWNDTSYTGPAPKGIPVPGQTTLTVPNNGGTATYAGCYLEGVGSRALQGPSFSNTTGMTLEMCAAFCSQSQSAFFATEYSQECYCGNSTMTATTSQSDCSFSCKGDNTELCGAGSRLSVWSLDKYKANAGSSGTGTGTGTSGGSSSATASAVPAATNVAYLGCYGETGNPRALTGLYTSGSTMSVDLCAQKAQALNLQYFGLEYASQCLAGSVLNPASTPIASTKCSMKCAGNSAQTCGGSNAISLYNNTQYIKPYNPNPVNVPNQPGSQYGYVGCYTEGVGARALGPTDKTGSAATPASASLTVEACAAFCFAKGYNWMGVENGNLCFCNAAGPINSAVLAPEGEAGCNVTCAGNPVQNCGAGSRLNVYQLKSGSGSARFAGATTAGNTNSTTKTGKRGLRFKVW